MPKKFKKKVKDVTETSDDMELISDHLEQLYNVLRTIDWQSLFVDYPAAGGGLPPPNVPKWPP